MARICIDLDGVIAKIKMHDEKYSNILPVPGAKKTPRTKSEWALYYTLYC